MQGWYASGLNPLGFSEDEKGMLITFPHVVQRTRDTLYDATKSLFDSTDDFETKKSAIETGLRIAEKKDPEFNRKLFR